MTEGSPDLPQPLVHHLLELRRRLLLTVGFFLGAFALSYHFSGEIFDLLTRPLAEVLRGEGPRRLIYTGMAEAFLTYLKVALFSALFLTLPLLSTQVWLFIGPGLYKTERKVALPFLIATPILFVLGALFAYFFIIPAAWTFFIQFETLPHQAVLPVQLEARVSEYLSLIMQLLLAFGFSFQLPVLLVLLARVGIVRSAFLKRKRRYAFILILIASAFLTPPDVLSMVGLALPLYGLFELSLFMMGFVEQRAQAP